jgi:hypothetical protein
MICSSVKRLDRIVHLLSTVMDSTPAWRTSRGSGQGDYYLRTQRLLWSLGRERRNLPALAGPGQYLHRPGPRSAFLQRHRLGHLGLKRRESRKFRILQSLQSQQPGWGSFEVIETTERDFTLRAPVVLSFPWERGDPDPDPEPDPDPQPDATPPNVDILSPADGARVRRGSQLTIEVAATDDTAVRKVTVLIDGSQVSQFLGDGPYSYRWRVPTDSRRRVSISAQAEDTTGNASGDSISVRLRGGSR